MWALKRRWLTVLIILLILRKWRLKWLPLLLFKDGLSKAKPTILEPIAHVEVIVPERYMGDIMGDINKRRGRILSMDPEGKNKKIVAEVPLSELYKYGTDLRSMTQSRGSYTYYFERYDEAPMEIQQKVIESRKKKDA